MSVRGVSFPQPLDRLESQPNLTEDHGEVDGFRPCHVLLDEERRLVRRQRQREAGTRVGRGRAQIQLRVAVLGWKQTPLPWKQRSRVNVAFSCFVQVLSSQF